MKTTLGMIKVNLQNQKLAFILTLVGILGGVSNYAMAALGSNNSLFLSIGMYPWIFLLLLAAFTPTRNFRNFMHINLKKREYIKGCAMGYILFSLLFAAINTACHRLVDPPIAAALNVTIINLIDIFGWAKNGVIIAFLQQFVFLLLLAALLHTLMTVQSVWYGIAIDIAIVAILSFFIPIASLRGILVGVLRFLFFNPSAWVQILVGLFLAAGIYALSIPTVRQQKI